MQRCPKVYTAAGSYGPKLISMVTHRQSVRQLFVSASRIDVKRRETLATIEHNSSLSSVCADLRCDS